MYRGSISVSLVLLQLHVALQLLWTPNCLKAAGIPDHLDGLQETVARWNSATTANRIVWPKPSFEDEVQEHSFHFRKLSQRQSTEQLSGVDFPCSLNETEVGAVYNETARIWLIDEGVLSRFNIQAIVNCTNENDTIFLKTENLIRPRTTVTIPWNLTLSGFFEGSLTGRERVPEANSKVAFTCPENGQLFVAKTSSFVLANVAVIGCNSSSNIILLEPRCANDVETSARSQLVHVDFARNTLLQNGSLLNATHASCTQLALEDVKFNRNRCSGQGCVLITTNTEFHGITAVRNRNSSDAPEECSFFSVQNMSRVFATDLSALKNEIRVLRIYNSSVRIRNSHFERNDRNQVSTSARRRSGGGALFANDSTVSIEGSTFQNNTALSGGALYVVFTGLNVNNCTFFQNKARTFKGGAIYSRLGSFFNLTSSNFSENVASAGGALTAENTRVSLADCQFIRNNASNSGACSFCRNSSISVIGSLFEGNRANKAFAGAISVEEDIRLEIRNSTFRANQANQNGGAVTLMSRCLLLMIDVTFTNNTAEDVGGAIAARSSTLIGVVSSSFTGNQASRGGAMYARFNSTLSISIPRSNQNEAEHGVSATLDPTGNNTNFESFFESNTANLAGGAIDLGNNATLSISNTSFKVFFARSLGNTAGIYGGAIRVLKNSMIYISNTTLSKNKGSDGGALHALNHCIVEISSCTIKGNTVRFFGGSISFNDSTTGIVTSSSIIENNAQLGGGFSTRGNSTLTLVESRLVKNKAESGGCLYMRASRASISNTIFRNSEAEKEGGAVFLFSQSNLSASNLTLVRNKAQDGGAIKMNGNCKAALDGSMFRDNDAKTGGALSLDDNCIALVTGSTFRNNAARSGGAIALESANLTIQDTNVTSNEAKINGGGLLISGSSFLDATGLSLSSNSASQRGGGMALLRRSSLLAYACFFEDNKASNGAGMYGESRSQMQFIRAQLQDCTFARNSALLSGGGLQLDTPLDRNNICLQESVSCGSVVLLNTSFFDNSAELHGSAILLSNPKSVLVAPGLVKGREEGFLDIANPSLTPVDFKGQYGSWTGNRVLSKATSNVVGSYGRSLSLSTNPLEENRIISNEESGFLLPNVQSGRELSTIQIITIDSFGDGPAPTIRHPFSVSVMSPESFFQGVITVNVSNGTGFLMNLTGFGTPGNYSLKISPPNHAVIEETTLMIQVRECLVGEEPTQDRRLCQRCGESSFNFDTQEADGCKPCPEHAACGGRYIVPNDGYWHKGPCHANIKQCITEEACTYDQREGKLLNFSENFTDCGMSGETLLNYSELLCRQGYEGPLCGSCNQSYGLSIVYKCSKCPHAMESLITLALLVFYLLVISSFTLRGGLPYQTKHTSAVGEESSRSTAVRNSSRSVAISVQMVERMREGYAPLETMQQPQYTNRSTPNFRQRNKAEMARWKTAEVLKIAINFLQVTAAAAGVAVRWTDGVMEMFKASEITGALTTVALFRPVDCFFPSSSALVRSLWRTMFGLFVPGIVVGTFIAYWGVNKIWKKKPMAFFWKRSLLSLMVVVYISYLGLTKLAVRSFYCVEVFDSENHFSESRTSYWAVDTAIKCYEKDHSILIGIGVSILVLVTLSFPLISAFVITRGEEQQEATESWTNETMGFLSRTFTKKFRYWESIVMLRKALLSVIVVFSYPLGGQLQTMLALLLLMFSLCLQTLCKPYRQEFNTLNHYEFSSLFVSCITLTLGQFLDSDRCSSFVKETVAFTIVFINITMFLVLLLACFLSGVDHMREVLEDEGIQVPDNSRWWNVIKVVFTTKMSQWCDSSD